MPTQKRRERAAEMIEETLTVLLAQAADERLNLVTVTEVEVNQDMSAAKVWVTMLGDETERKASWEGLKHATGFIRHQIAETLDLRRAPTLTFHYDDSIERSKRVQELFEQLEAEKARQALEQTDPAAQS